MTKDILIYNIVKLLSTIIKFNILQILNQAEKFAVLIPDLFILMEYDFKNPEISLMLLKSRGKLV